MSGLLVCTDLDGTLLDHHSYSFEAAQPALQRLRELNVPLVFNTSKTREESQRLQALMGLQGPIIVENGSAIYGPELCIELGRPRAEIRQILDELQLEQGYRCQGFSRLGLDDVVAATGLSQARAQAAMRRAWSEPLLWQDTSEAVTRLRQELAAYGLNVLQGGRFVHVLGPSDKGKALHALLRSEYEGLCRSLALGDSQNDAAMLLAADDAVWVRSPNGPPPQVAELERRGIEVTTGLGPVGWNTAVLQWLSAQVQAQKGQNGDE